MPIQNKIPNAIAAIRVSTTQQGTHGDSPEAQREQIERFAEIRGVNLKEIFLFMESASKEEQPMQQAVNYCIDPKHKIDIFIVKSIDRFTRGGSYVYSNLKNQLDRCNVQLVDIYGVIGTRKVNTLEHLGISYKWSVYDPTKNSEILEAERASDEKRDIMSRMIGAQIRYARMGYWMRKPPLGLIGRTVETINGSRQILMPEPGKAPWIIAMFELKARRTLSNLQIVDRINDMGYRTPIRLIRDKKNRMKIIARRGGNKLSVKIMDNHIKNMLYAGVICEKWTSYKPIKGRFNGLVSIETFNQANWNNLEIVQNGSELEIKDLKLKNKAEQIKRSANDNYPFRGVVACPECGRVFCGSASRGSSNKFYPAYHCSHHGHYLRIPKERFEQSIYEFVSHITTKPGYVEKITSYVITEWHKREDQNTNNIKSMQSEIAIMEENIRTFVSNMKYMKSAISISYTEDEISNIESEIRKTREIVAYYQDKIVPSDIEIEHRIKQYLSDIGGLISSGDCDYVIRSLHFALLFKKIPSYYEVAECDPINLCDIFQYSESKSICPVR
jgi:hypothetical protein